MSDSGESSPQGRKSRQVSCSWRILRSSANKVSFLQVNVPRAPFQAEVSSWYPCMSERYSEICTESSDFLSLPESWTRFFPRWLIHSSMSHVKDKNALSKMMKTRDFNASLMRSRRSCGERDWYTSWGIFATLNPLPCLFRLARLDCWISYSICKLIPYLKKTERNCPVIQLFLVGVFLYFYCLLLYTVFSNYNIKSYSSRSGRLHTEIGDRYQMSSKTEKRYDYRMTFMHIDIHTHLHTQTHTCTSDKFKI